MYTIYRIDNGRLVPLAKCPTFVAGLHEKAALQNTNPKTTYTLKFEETA